MRLQLGEPAVHSLKRNTFELIVKMSGKVILEKEKHKWNEDSTVIKYEMKEEIRQEYFEIHSRKARGYDLLQPIKGARPDPVDDVNSGLYKTPDNIVRPSSVIKRKDEQDEGVNLDEIKLLNEKTSVNSSDMVLKATHQSLEEWEQNNQLKTEGLPTAASQVEDNPEAKLTNDKANQRKCKKKILSSTKESNGGPTCNEQYEARRKSVAIHVRGFEAKEIVAVAFVVFLAFYGSHAFTGPKNQAVKIGGKVVLTCSTELENPVQWYKDFKLIYSGYDMTEEVQGWCTMADGPRGDYNLSISYADKITAGTYACQEPGSLKKISAKLILLDVNCSIVKTNKCTAEITGSKVTRILWEVIHEGRVTNASGTVPLNNSDIVDGTKRQNITNALILPKDFLRINGSCKLILEFSPAITITVRPGEEVANNAPTYTHTVEFPFSTNDTFVAEALPMRKEPDFRSMELWLNILLIFGIFAFGLIMILVPILCNFSNQWTDVNPPAFI